MGAIIAKFRKKQTTFEVLETLEQKIQEIEEYKSNTELQRKKVVGHLILFSVGLYVIAAVLFYFFFFPATLYDQLFYITPLLIFPIIIVFVKKLLTWYFNRKIRRNQTKLTTMKSEKRKLLDQVMDTETYKKAKEILEKFAPEQLRNKQMVPGGAPKNLPMPRTILARDRTVLDKMVEYLIGDGPNNRFALICKNCASHNGMALREEFEYISFRCCYCFTFNPARKQRVAAPRLEDKPNTLRELQDQGSTSESERNSPSDTDSDNEPVDNKPTANATANISGIEKVSESPPKTEEEKKDD